MVFEVTSHYRLKFMAVNARWLMLSNESSNVDNLIFHGHKLWFLIVLIQHFWTVIQNHDISISGVTKMHQSINSSSDEDHPIGANNIPQFGIHKKTISPGFLISGYGFLYGLKFVTISYSTSLINLLNRFSKHPKNWIHYPKHNE